MNAAIFARTAASALATAGACGASSTGHGVDEVTAAASAPRFIALGWVPVVGGSCGGAGGGGLRWGKQAPMAPRNFAR
jgi:hypothetical protein